MRVSRPGELRFLDPAVIARLASLELRARTIVEGFISGLHRSPLKGFSVEFAEYRQYFPGDDLSTIDWKVFARTDRHVVKKFEEETNLKGYLLLDVSRSMAYGSGPLTKLEYGSTLAACLAYLMQKQRDAAGLATFDERIRTVIAPGTRPGHLNAVVHALTAVTVGSATDAGLALNPDRIVRGLKHLRFRGSDVLVFHLLDHAELTFPFESPARFRDMEDGLEVLISPAEIRQGYLASINGLVDTYRRELRAAGIDYRLVDTSQPLDESLLEYLATRSRRH
jgi:uncharacterized protein (DUF58 family)